MSNNAKDRAVQQSKIEFLTSCQRLSKQIEDVFINAIRLGQYWEDNDYTTELTTEDLDPFRFNKEELVEFIGLMNQIKKMAVGLPVDTAPYQRINNLIK
jgi:hypothetical protein